MPTSNGLSYSMNSLPRSAWTIGACRSPRERDDLRRARRRQPAPARIVTLAPSFEHVGRGATRLVARAAPPMRCGVIGATAPAASRRRGQDDVAGDDHDRDAALARPRRPHRHLEDRGGICRRADAVRSRRCTRGTAPAGCVSWKYSDADLARCGMCAAIASTGTRLRCASNRPLIRCRLPGPQLPRRRPARR